MALTPLVPAIPMARSLAKAASNGDNDEEDLLVLVGGNDADVDVGTGDGYVVLCDGLVPVVLTTGDIDVYGRGGETLLAAVFPIVLRTNTTLPAASNDCLISHEVSRGIYMVGGDCSRSDGVADWVGGDCNGDGADGDGDDRVDDTLLCVGLDIGGNCVGGDLDGAGGGGGVTSIDGKLYGIFSGVALIKLLEFPPVVT